MAKSMKRLLWNALQNLSQLLMWKVMEPGLVDSSEPWLGASPDGPDGIITVNGEKYLVEVKCPYSAQNMTVEEALRNIKAFCLSKEGDKLTLRHSHRYFYQVQVELHVCKLTKCYFLVWTLKDAKMLLCSLDPEGPILNSNLH